MAKRNFKTAPWWGVELHSIGQENMPVLVIDNFFPNPEILIEDVKTKTFKANAPYYPGIRAKVPGAYFRPLMNGLSDALVSIFRYNKGLEIQECHYSLTTTPPEDLSFMQRLPHVDGGNDMKLALLHYLCGDEHGGTGFYKQLSTGFETVSAARFKAYEKAVISDHDRLGEPDAGYFSETDHRFEQIYKVNAKFNRAVLYFGLNLHSVLIGQKALTSEPMTGRLTINTFLTPI